MKKLLCVLLCVFLLVSFGACGSVEQPLPSSDEETPVTTVTKTTQAEITQAKTTQAKTTKTEENETSETKHTTITTKTTRTTKTKKTRSSTTSSTAPTTTKRTLPQEGYPDVSASMALLAEENKVRFLGRTYTYVGEDSRRMLYGNTGFVLEGNLSGSVTIRINVEKACCALNITVDGETRTEWVAKGSKTVFLADDLPKGKHTITVTKGTAHHAGELTVETVSFTGVLQTPAAEKLQIEFIGDSVTVGEGMYGNAADFSSLAETYNTYDGYAAQVARNLKAGVSTVAACGAKVPGIRNSFLEYGWDFEGNHKDVVVINMGTNDLGWPHVSLSDVESILRPNCIALIEAVREKYGKDTYIVWAYGMMFDKDKAFFKDLTEQYAKDNNDNRVLFCDLSEAKDNAGNARHPSKKGNDKAAEILTNFLKEHCDI